MRRSVVVRSFALVVVASFAASQALAQAPGPSPQNPQTQNPEVQRFASAVLVLPVRGTTSRGTSPGTSPETSPETSTGTTPSTGTFTGTLSLQRFASRGDQVLAVGMITGTVVDASAAPVGTFVIGPVEIPVQVRPGGAAPTGAAGPRAEDEPPATSGGVAAFQPQPQQDCGVLNLALASTTFNALGLVLSISPITFDLTGETGGTQLLGTLVCTILGSLTNVVNLVGLLDELLGVLAILSGLGLVGGLPG
jgi:hypothetical protein